jgi:5'-nucleotidase
MPHAKFEFLSANYDFKNMMDGLVKPYKVFNKNGLRLAFWNWD